MLLRSYTMVAALQLGAVNILPRRSATSEQILRVPHKAK